MVLQIESLKKTFKLFCAIEYEFKFLKLSCGSHLNYVEIRKPSNPLSPATKDNDCISNSIRRSNQLDSVNDKTLVLMHGFGLGLGFFFANFDALANFQSSPFDRIVAIDWPGMGHSSRGQQVIPKRTLWDSIALSSREAEVDDKLVQKSVDFFIDSLEEWRQVDSNSQQASIDKTQYIFAGHSLGGYLCSRYVMKYPEAASGLILVSPVGLNANPALENRLDSLSSNRYLLDSWGLLRTSSIMMLSFLWKANLTPQTLLRLRGEAGLDNVNSFLSRRFREKNKWAEDDIKRKVLADYIHDISVQKPSGEYALNSLLFPVIYFHQNNNDGNENNDTTDRESKQGSKVDNSRKGQTIKVGVFARQSLNEPFARRDIRVPTLLLFGDDDWLRYESVDVDIAKWQQNGLDITYRVIERAGHHLYLDNPEQFHSTIFEWAKRKLL